MHYRLIASLSLLLIATVPAQANDETDAILAVVDRAYEAIKTQDNEIWTDILLPEGLNLSFRSGKDGGSELDERGVRSFEFLLANPSHDEHEYVERWTGEPTVLVDGPLAVVWGEYDFWIDGEFSHCGRTLFDFAKVDGDWKIFTFNFTVEHSSCPTDPAASKD